MGSINTKPVGVGKPPVGAVKKTAPQAKKADAKAATPAPSTSISISSALASITANQSGHDAKDNVLMLVPAISTIARPAQKTALTVFDRKAFFTFICSALCVTSFPDEMIDLILQFALFNQFVYDITVAPTRDLSILGFFSHADEKAFSKAVVLADQVSFAAPLEQIKDQVMANPQILLTTFRINYHLAGMPEPLVIQGTPEQIALILLDVTLRLPKFAYDTDTSTVVDVGLANQLRKLRKELLPDTLPLAREQATVAAPVLDEKAQQAMDAEQLPILKKAFDFIKANDTDKAVKAVRDYIKNIKPQVIANNIYFFKLVRLLINAFTVLADRGSQLTDGAQEDQYCFKVIGFAIEMAFGERIRQLLESNIRPLVCYRYPRRKLVTAVKSNSSFLNDVEDSSLVLGSTFYYSLSSGRRFATEKQGEYSPFSALSSAFSRETALLINFDYYTGIKLGAQDLDLDGFEVIPSHFLDPLGVVIEVENFSLDLANEKSEAFFSNPR